MNHDRINELYSGQVFGPETQLAARDRIHWICSQTQGEKVLDIGCSQGIICLLLGREGFHCTGVDIEREAVEYARAELEKEEDLTKQRVEFQLADASQLKFDDDTFDTVILGEILEHLIHPAKVLQEARRVLKEAGKVVITVPFGLNSHIDHKRTYFPNSFLETVRPFFSTLSIDTMQNYILYCGKKESSYNPSEIPCDTLLDELLGIQKKVEERCIAQEVQFEQTVQSLIEKEKKLHEQVTSLAEQNASIQEKSVALEKVLKEQIASIQKMHTTLEADLNEKLTSLNQENSSLQAKCAALEGEIGEQIVSKANALAYQESVYHHSARWRIGSIFVSGFGLVRDIFTHPIHFSKEANNRFREYYREIKPLPLTEGVRDTKDDSPIEVLLAYPPLGTYDNVSSEDLSDNAQGTISLGVIMDEFTYNCLQPEARLITFRPDNWRWILEKEKPGAVFVESAWNGNQGSWQYRVAKYENNMGDELHHLLAWAKDKKIPTIFWNKEDPPHYDRFIDTAKLFDYVFTSDADCIPKYLEDLKNKRVHALPFAAQPKIHNPVLHEPRNYDVCFSGTYYGASFPERKKEMDLLLKPALDFGLHIYDRQYGMVGPAAENYRFPDIYQSAIRGRLDYPEMVKAYKKFKVCLNVNSVKTSPTMFSRRVFELMASGTVVVSTYSKGIEEILGNDLVLFSESEEDTRMHLENLLGDEDYWANLSVRGIRKIMEAHTYRHRLNDVFELCGLGTLPFRWPSFTVVARVNDLQEIENLCSNLARQTYRQFNVILLLLEKSGLESRGRAERVLASLKQRDPVNRMRNALKGIRVDTISSHDEISRCFKGDYIAIMNEKDYYGNNYLKDYALAVKYSNQFSFIGKHSHFAVRAGEKVLLSSGYEFLNVSDVPTSTLSIRKEALDTIQLETLLESDRFESSDESRLILSLDRFNYIQSESHRPISPSLIEKVNI